MTTTTIGIIGGTGLYDLEGLEQVEQRVVDTPFGSPSSPVTIGYLSGTKLVFLSRHGEHHRLLPAEINSRANIYALKREQVDWCISVSAVGSLKEEFAPGHIVVPDQLIDRTSGIRPSTFFGRGLCAHIPFAEPFCPVLSELLVKEARAEVEDASCRVHQGGTYLCMEGPQFSTRAESHLYRSWGASLIGMTVLPEAKLAREAEISYATLALVTDYDCWRSSDADIDIPELLATMRRNLDRAKRVLRRAVPLLAGCERPALVSEALKFALITPPEHIPQSVREELEPILGRYIPPSEGGR